ncbi:hypothetical protein CPB83DRAFT_875505 [Crepidotus variabilis]|uniref:NAD(P)-binding protein n=1 Tax=Crepidotus variabilis TaxID=179855 RepID=A0A9P6JQL9_9AGAR|nr:hypothetical protein CPB83DRAFT_875505 [Crepidotus variabilis]
MSGAIQMLKEFYPCRTKFSVDEIPDLTGKIIIVTGANTGIGKETPKELLAHNAKVYMACRKLKELTGKDCIFLKLDLSNLSSIRATTEEFLSGVFRPPVEQITVQGYDLQFGVNTLAPFFLTKCLLPALLNAAKACPDSKPRVINTASAAAYSHSTIDFDILKDTEKRRKQGDMFLYGQSKGTILFSNELARRWGDQGITDLQRSVPKVERAVMNKLVLYPADKGALTQLWAGTMPECAEYNGQYLAPWARLSKLPKGTDDLELAKKMWAWLEDQAKPFE